MDIWFIRHCDKDAHSGNDCSIKGYDRARNWANYPPFSSMQEPPIIITSSYRRNKEYPFCRQRSERMYITSHILHDTLQLTSDVDANHCVGEGKHVLREIVAKKPKNVIVVWEHDEIIEMIRMLGIPLTKWKNRWRDEYGIVFRIQLSDSSTLSYDCFSYTSPNTSCITKDMQQTWLAPFIKIDRTNQGIEKNVGIDFIGVEFIGIGFIGIVFIGIFIFFIRNKWKKQQEQQQQQQNKRQYYTIII